MTTTGTTTGGTGTGTGAPGAAGAVSEDVRRFHDECLVFLAYTVAPVQVSAGGAELGHMRRWLPGPRVDLPKLRAGGVDAVFLSAGLETIHVERWENSLWATEPPRRQVLRPVFRGPAVVKRVLRNIDALHRMIAANEDVIELALCAADVERIAAKGKIAGILHLTRCAIDDDLAMLRMYHALGVRAIQIAYDDGEPSWVDGCQMPPVAHGLTPFGREVIGEMNRLGLLVDLAHASDASYAAVLDVSTQPVISSHAAARARCNVWRNLTDGTMRRIAAGGGQLGLFFGSGFLDPHYWEQPAALAFRGDLVTRDLELLGRHGDDPFALAAALRTADGPAAPRPGAPAPRPVPIASLVRQFAYCAEVMGEDHVCVGTDFGGIRDDGVIGCDEPSKLPNLTAALLGHGYSRATVRKLLGTNLLRLFRDVAG
jgi:membrane dipeptidase